MKSFRELLNSKTVVLDGAIGTVLLNSGLKIGQKPEMLNITSPDTIIDLHCKYLKAGSDIIYTNTFGANSFKLKDYPYQEAILKGIQCAQTAVKLCKKGLIAYEIGSIGDLLEPLGSVSFDDAYAAFAEQVKLADSGVDMYTIETMSDLYELKAAVLAVKENSDKPIIATMSFGEDGRTFAGCSVEAMVATLEGLGVDALGLNCSLAPQKCGDIVDRLLSAASIPVVVKPNAGLPVISDGVASFDVDRQDFAKHMTEFVDRGVRLVGGCCGTDDSYIKLLADAVANKKPKPCVNKRKVWVASGINAVELDRPRMIGERINPTGKAAMKRAIYDIDTGYFQQQAIEQAQAGADVLDINVGLPGIDEAQMMRVAIKSVQAVQDCPIQIDSSAPKAIESGLRYVNGKAIVNSVNGDEETMRAIFPLIKKYGALTVGLTLDKNGVPKTVEGRLAIARRIIDTAKQYGIAEQDIIIDCLTLTAGAEQAQARVTLDAIKMLKQNYSVKTLLGVSNISFGLPERGILNGAFLTMALESGLDLAIVNPNAPSIRQSFLAFNLLAGHDNGGSRYIEEYSSRDTFPSEGTASDRYTLGECIAKSLKSEAVALTHRLLNDTDGLTLIDTQVIPALDAVGGAYEKGTLYLPQLISCADTAKAVCDVIKVSLKDSGKSIKNVKIMLATVEGDVHDIGKNIVKTVLENYGYRIIDLGRDVKVDEIVAQVGKHRPEVLGLSALMTTTVKNMQRTVSAVKAEYPDTFICVGGAVLTKDAADKIGADAYSKNPQELVRLLQSAGF